LSGSARKSSSRVKENNKLMEKTSEGGHTELWEQPPGTKVAVEGSEGNGGNSRPRRCRGVLGDQKKKKLQRLSNGKELWAGRRKGVIQKTYNGGTWGGVGRSEKLRGWE